MKTLIILTATLLLMCLVPGPLPASQIVYGQDGQPTAVAQPGAWNPSTLLPATLIDSWDTTPEYNWSLNADFTWANVYDTNDITDAHVLTELQYYASPTLGVEYEFYMTTDNGGWPDDGNMTLLASRNDLDGGGQWGWVTIDVSAAGYVVQPGQVYWFVRRCPVGGSPGFTWSSATNTSPPVNPPVKITQSFGSGGWSDWIQDWWMLFKVYGEIPGPVPDIQANGQDDTLTLNYGSSLTVDVSLDPGNEAGNNADWWVVTRTPFNWYYYHLVQGYIPGFATTFQGPLMTVSSHILYSGTNLPVGTYDFYFGVDMNMNGSLDLGVAYHDVVTVIIQ